MNRMMQKRPTKTWFRAGTLSLVIWVLMAAAAVSASIVPGAAKTARAATSSYLNVGAHSQHHFHWKLSAHLKVGHSSTVKITLWELETHQLVRGATVRLNANGVGIQHVRQAKTRANGVALFRHVRPNYGGPVIIRVSKHGFHPLTVESIVR